MLQWFLRAFHGGGPGIVGWAGGSGWEDTSCEQCEGCVKAEVEFALDIRTIHIRSA
jgi:hypothetical protein